MNERNPSDMTNDELLSALDEAVAAHRRTIHAALGILEAGGRLDLATLDLLRDELGDDFVDELMEAWSG